MMVAIIIPGLASAGVVTRLIPGTSLRAEGLSQFYSPFLLQNLYSTSLRFPFACLANKRRKVAITPDFGSYGVMDIADRSLLAYEDCKEGHQCFVLLRREPECSPIICAVADFDALRVRTGRDYVRTGCARNNYCDSSGCVARASRLKRVFSTARLTGSCDLRGL
jgi:hypothetical protein